MASATNKNIVVEWLKSLHLGQYAESFIDNGYDDLEICKQIGDPDLDAIGVLNANHRSRLLGSIKTLREEGAASVYFTLEESQIIQENCKLDSDSKSSSEKLESPGGSARSRRSNSATSLAGDFVDDYEEGKAQLVRIPKLQLKMLIRDKLHQDNIKLSAQPYSTQVRIPTILNVPTYLLIIIIISSPPPPYFHYFFFIQFIFLYLYVLLLYKTFF